MRVHIGIDIGSTTLTAVAIDLETQGTVGAVTVPNNAETTTPEDRARGRSEWDFSSITSAAVRATRELVDRLSATGGGRTNAAAIGVTGQQQGLQLYDSNLHSVGPFIGWQDQRCGDRIPGGGDETYLDRIVLMGGSGFDRSGCPVVTGYTAPILFWLKQNDQLPSHLRASTGPEFFVSQITGEAPVVDPTDTVSWGVFDVVSRNWNTDLVRDLSLDPAILLPLAESCTIAGGLKPEIAEAMGIGAGTPVSVASGDHQCAFAGAVAEYEEMVAVNVGTGGQASVYVGAPLERGSLDLRPFIQRGYLLAGLGEVGGRTFRVLRDFFARAALDVFAIEADGDEIYRRLAQLAEEVAPGADGVQSVPLFLGSRRDPKAKAQFSGLTPATLTPGHLARSLFESMAGRLKGYYEEAVSLGATQRSRLAGSGNGLRSNPVLRESLAAAFGLSLELTDHTEEAAVGAALCSAVAVGDFPDIAAASRSFVRY